MYVHIHRFSSIICMNAHTCIYTHVYTYTYIHTREKYQVLARGEIINECVKLRTQPNVHTRSLEIPHNRRAIDKPIARIRCLDARQHAHHRTGDISQK